MAAAGEERKKIQIYASTTTTSGRQVTPYWRGYRRDPHHFQLPLPGPSPYGLLRFSCFFISFFSRFFCIPGVVRFGAEKYERDAKKYWDIFYKRHQDKFFKDRHYLDKEWGAYFNSQEGEKLVVLEVGCGAGNTIFPLISIYPDVFVHACDFSPRAIDLVKAHKDFRDDRVNAFVCDLTVHDLSEKILPSSVDIVTM